MQFCFVFLFFSIALIVTFEPVPEAELLYDKKDKMETPEKEKERKKSAL